jgi:syntaxin 18
MQNVQALEDLETARLKEMDAKKTLMESFFIDEKKEATRKLVAAHRSGIIWYLKYNLQDLSRLQQSQQEVRLQRQVQVRDTAVEEKQMPVFIEDEEQDFVSNLSGDQIQALEQENKSLLEGFESMLNQVRVAEKSIAEIASLHAQLAEQLDYQSDLTDKLYQDAVNTSDAVKAGNVQLKRAKKRQSTLTRWLVAILIFFSIVLLLLDIWYS